MTRVKVRAYTGRRERRSSRASFGVSDVVTEKLGGHYGNWQTSGSLHSPFAALSRRVRIVSVYHERDGSIIGGQEETLGSVYRGHQPFLASPVSSFLGLEPNNTAVYAQWSPPG